MPDEHRAVEAELDAYRPAATPPFALVRARRRARGRRRTGGAVAVSALAAVGVALLPSVLGSGQGGPVTSRQAAGPEPTAAQDGVRYGYAVSTRDAGRELERCLSLPGVLQGLTLTTSTPVRTGQIAGSGNADAFQACVEDIASVVHVTVTRFADTLPGRPVSFSISYAGPASYDGRRDDAVLRSCLDLPGVPEPVDPFFTHPPTYAVTVAEPEHVDAFRACLAGIGGISVLETAGPGGRPGGTPEPTP